MDLGQLLSKYQVVFDKKLGLVLRTQARLFAKPEAKPKYYKIQLVPYMLKKQIEKEFVGRRNNFTSSIFRMCYTHHTPAINIWIYKDYKVTEKKIQIYGNYKIV